MVVVVVAFVRAEQKFHMGMLVRIADNVEKRARDFLIVPVPDFVLRRGEEAIFLFVVQHFLVPPVQ